MSYPDFPGAYPDPGDPGRSGQDGRHGAPSRDYGAEDYGWDRGAPQGGSRSGRRAARAQAPRRGMSARDRLAAQLGTGQGDTGYPGPGGYPGGPGGAAAAGFPSGRRGTGRNGGGNGRGGNGRGGRGGRGGRPHQKGDWWRHWTWKKAIGLSLATGTGFFIIILVGVFYMYSRTPIPAASSFATGQASRVYFRDGKTLVGMFGSTNRQILSSNQIPTMVKHAMVASEDKHFYDEGGISPTGIIRAAIADLTSGQVQQGGSTITQELVRNYYLGIGDSETATRKIKEIFVAEKLASQESKDWILTNYMNTVPTGAGIYGFGAAAQTYFGVPVNKLTVAQAAMIAAMPQAPDGYNPNPSGGVAYRNLVYRWHYVLNTMVQEGWLSQSQASAQKFPKLVKAFNNSWSGYRGYIMEAVMGELQNTYHYTPEQINNGGLRIITTFSKPMMNSLYASVKQEESLIKGGMPNWAHAGAVLEQPSTGEIWAMYGGPNFEASAKKCGKIRCQWNMALQNREQVGSSFKPYVLALARQQGMSVKTSTLDGHSPLYIPPVANPSTYASWTQPTGTDAQSWYEVGNDAGDAQAAGVSVVTASAASLNTAYTDLYHRVAGSDGMNMVHMAQAFGVNTAASGLYNQRSEVGTALGQASLSVEEQASTFSTLANNGQYIAPHVILQIQQQKPNALMTTTKANPIRRMVLTPAEDSDVDYALSFDTKPGGTAASAGLPDGRQVIAKTGTTNLSQSAFFIGSIPQFTLAVGMFTNQQGCPAKDQTACAAMANLATAPPAGVQTLYGLAGLQGYGGQEPASIWHDFAMKEFAPMSVQSFPTPDFGGTAWNMLGPYTPKPKKVHPTPNPSITCQGFFFGRHCKHNQDSGGGQPTPTPTLPGTQVTATPTPTFRLPGAKR